MALPTKKTKPNISPDNISMLLYGVSGFGKSPFCADAPDALFLATEPGLSALEVYQSPINKWEDLLLACKEISEGKHDFRSIIIDTIDEAYRFCVEFICTQYSVKDLGDLKYGKGYSLASNEFQRVIMKLARLPYGLIFVSHATEKEFETRTGKSTKVIPTLPKKISEMIMGLVDLILYCDFEKVTNSEGRQEEQRVLRTKPTSFYDAGDRSGRLPTTLPFKFGALESALTNGKEAANDNKKKGSK